MSTLEIAAGTVFGGEFQVVRPLGVGGMGAVFVVEQRSTQTLRALKVMQRELVADRSLRERFEQEARIGAQIESDHVVQVVGAGVDAATGTPWIAMELLKGLPLDAYMREKGARPAAEVRFVFDQLCHALSAAHDRGIVHRDLKPGNVFLSVPRVVGLSYVVKVLDFGIAKVLAESKTTKTAAVGTPLYMAPEQYEAGRVTPATDVWALGLIAFEMLTGRSYWKAARDGNATPASIMYETCLGEIVPPSSRVSDLGIDAALPDGFDAWFARCLQRQPELRFLDARAAHESLAAVLGAPEAPTDRLPISREQVRTPATAAMTSSEARTPATAAMTSSEARTPATVAMTSSDARTPATVSMGVSMGTEVAAQPIEPSKKVHAPNIAATEVMERRPRVSRPVILGAAAGIVLLGVAAIWAKPRGETKTAPPPSPTTTTSVASKPALPTSEFVATSNALTLQGRLLHKQLAAGTKTETYVMLDLRGAEVAPKVVMPVHLSLVIDRSGSMKGERWVNAIAAAKTAVDRLRDGDQVSVVAFDDAAQLVVPPTTLDAASRTTVLAALSKIAVGGNTCMSCGLDTALDKLGASPDVAHRILLLSDGEANRGVKDLAGFEAIGHKAQKADVSITTIGVGHDYDPKSLMALSRASSGQHHYAASEAALPAIFDAQAKAMASVVAVSTEAKVQLAPGVELVKVFDRTHRIEGDASDGITVRVPLGQFAAGERKTILLKVAVRATDPDRAAIADVEVSFRETGASKVSTIQGKLAAPIAIEGFEVDAVVEARVKSSETAAALLKANELFEQGKTKEAIATLDAQSKALAAQKQKWTIAPPPAKPAPNVMKDVETQQTAVDDAKKKYDEVASSGPAPAPTMAGGQAASPPPPAAMPAAKAVAKKAAADAWNAGY